MLILSQSVPQYVERGREGEERERERGAGGGGGGGLGLEEKPMSQRMWWGG